MKQSKTNANEKSKEQQKKKKHTGCSCQFHFHKTNLNIDYTSENDYEEVLVMQQHCGGNALPVFKALMKPDSSFSFRYYILCFIMLMYVRMCECIDSLSTTN